MPLDGPLVASARHPPRTRRRDRALFSALLGRVGKRIGGASPSGLSHGRETRDHRRAVGGPGVVVSVAEGSGTAPDGHAVDGRGDRVAVPHRGAVARCPGAVRELELDLSAVLRVVRGRHLGQAARDSPDSGGCQGRGGVDGLGGLHDHACAPAWCDAPAPHRGLGRTTRIPSFAVQIPSRLITRSVVRGAV